MADLFTNPVIPGFFPDPTVCFDGTHYYVANSSFEYFPGAPLWRSTDFVSWDFVGNILTRRSQFVAGDQRRSGGIFGSTLRYHDGLFWFITTNMSDFGNGHTIVTAADPTGEWSEPVFVREAVGIDPDLAWTEDGRCLLTWCGFGYNSGSAIMQAEIDPATGDLLEEPRAMWPGTGLAYTEGPHLIQRGDYWYLVVAEGGTESGHVVSVARSRQPEGPFEGYPGNPVFTHRSLGGATRNIGHADLVEGPDGQWRAVLLGVRAGGVSPSFHVLGRETFGANVQWVDDWPVIEPITPEVAASTAFVDTFAKPELDARWVSPGGDPADGLRCTRVRDLSWDAEVALTHPAPFAFTLRIDDDHFYSIRIIDGAATVVARIGPLEQHIGSFSLSELDGPVHLGISSRPAAGAGNLGGNHGPDDIHLTVRTEAETHTLATLDGRYLSTEVAGGFTGRVLCLDGTAASFSYRPYRP